ncbi:hypothetical protein R69749_08410 [Paraburkholderia domus]|nr:hypothetical protein R69749_08410 [Paraburkholderia domus]
MSGHSVATAQRVCRKHPHRLQIPPGKPKISCKLHAHIS